MTRKRAPRGPYSQPHVIICAWCGVQKRCTNSDRNTCGGKCRLRLHRYVKEAGFTPLFPPGPITTSAALDTLWLELLRRERRRREKMDEATAMTNKAARA